MSEHHPAGPSQLGRIMLCLGSMILAERARKEGSALSAYAEAAQSGTDLHTLLYPKVPLPAGMDSDDREAVEAARAYIAEQTAGFEYVGYEIRIEGPCGMFGTADVYALNVKQGRKIIDLKFGRAPLIPSSIEWQMKALGSDIARRDPVDVLVFDARTRTEYHGRFEDIDALRAEVAAVIEAAQKPDAPLNPSPDACRYCPATGICSAFDRSVVRPIENGADKALDLSPAQVSRWLQLLSIVAAREDAIREKAREILLQGGELPGYKLTTINTRRLPEKAKLLEVLDSATLLKAAKFGIGDLEKALGKSEFARLVGPHVSTSSQTRIERV